MGVEKLKTLAYRHQFDTDAFIEDAVDAEAADSAFNDILGGTSKDGVFDVISNLIFLWRSQNEQYSSGKRFFYWDFYRENQSEYNKVYGRMTIEGNRGYKLCDWFVSPKYKDFKTEIRSNPLSGLSRKQWEETLQKATLKLAAYNKDPKRRKLVSVRWAEKIFGIKARSEVTVAHIMALLFYTNYTKASYEFSASFRRIFWNETDGALKLRRLAVEWISVQSLSFITGSAPT